jgi:hypothetical protein
MCGFVFSYSIQGFGRLIHTGGVLLCQGRLIDELGNDMDSTATRLDFIQVVNLPPFSPVQGNLARKSSVKLQGVLILFCVLPI